MVSNVTVKYWLDWFKFLAEDRLSGPQCDEAMQVLALVEQYADLTRQRDDLREACKDLLTAVPTSDELRHLYDAAGIPMPYYHGELSDMLNRVVGAIWPTGQGE